MCITGWGCRRFAIRFDDFAEPANWPAVFEDSIEKVIAIVHTDVPDRSTAFKAPDENSRRIAGHLLSFWAGSEEGRLPQSLLPLQSGVGNIANAVLYGLQEGPFEGMTAYTEVIQDGLINMMKSGSC